jgi:hypothetical protein
MATFKRILLFFLFLLFNLPCFCWGFYAHKKINHLAVFLLPPEMMVFYKQYIYFLAEHAVDPDKRRYALPEEAARHYIDIDKYGLPPFADIPHSWDSAVWRFGTDTLQARGIVPWWIGSMQDQLTNAFKLKNQSRILKLSAEIGHYIADAHVPLHVSSNHNGQYSNQKGIHGFWESRLPELLAEREWDFFIGKAVFLPEPKNFIWDRVLESAAAADTVLRFEKILSNQYGPDRRYAFEDRNGILLRQYASDYSRAYDKMLNGMVERRMRQSIFAVASFWYTAWVNAGQPNLKLLVGKEFTDQELREFELLNLQWLKSAGDIHQHD